MSKSTYDKQAILQEHVNLPLLHEGGVTASEKNIVIKIENQDIEILVEAVAFISGANQSQTTFSEICIYELNVPTTGGTDYTGDIVSANLDRSAGRDLIGVVVQQDVTYDLTGAVRLMREGGVANNRVATKVPVIGVNYSLRKYTEYLIRSNVVEGDTGNSTSTLIADFILNQE